MSGNAHDSLTSVHGWQETWDEYSSDALAHANTMHCMSGGLINMMIYLDANPQIKCEKIILESPVWTSAEMMGLFDALYRGKSRGKTHYLSSWKMHVEGSHHYFTDKLLKPFSEDKLNEVRFHINDLICARCNEVYVIVHPNDKLIDPTNVEYLRKACIRNNVKFSVLVF